MQRNDASWFLPLLLVLHLPVAHIGTEWVSFYFHWTTTAVISLWYIYISQWALVLLSPRTKCVMSYVLLTDAAVFKSLIVSNMLRLSILTTDQDNCWSKIQQTKNIGCSTFILKIYLSFRFLSTVPSRLAGFLLKRALNKLCTSGLRNWGIPSLALYRQHKKQLLSSFLILGPFHCTYWSTCIMWAIWFD